MLDFSHIGRCKICALTHKFSYRKKVKKTKKPVANDKIVDILLIFYIYPPFTRKRIVSLYFGRYVRTRLGVAISEEFGPPVFCIKAGAFR